MSSLAKISNEEDEAGRGMLSLLVVHKDGDKMPGKGFFTLAEARGRDVSDRERLWLDEYRKVVDYWASQRA